MGQFLLDCITYCTLLHAPKTYTDAIAFPLKERIIQLAIRQPEKKDVHENTDVFYHLDQLRIKLESFIENERADTVMNRLLKSVDFPFDKRNSQEIFEKRKNLVSRQCISDMECDAIASLIVKKLDQKFQLHCDQPNCGESCKFHRVQCPNDGCTMMMSRMYLDQHDGECPFKIIKCECGDVLRRHELEIHLAQSCKLREVECPFKKIGCTKVVRACNIQKHLEEEVNTHLLLAMNRMLEYQDVINNLNIRVLSLEDQNRELQSTLENYMEKSTTEISQLNQNFEDSSMALANHEASCKKEFIKLSR